VHNKVGEMNYKKQNFYEIVFINESLSASNFLIFQALNN